MNTSRDLRANTRQSLQEQAHALHKEKRTRDISNRDEGPVGYTWSPRPLTAIRVAYFNADGQHNKDDLIHAAQAAAACGETASQAHVTADCTHKTLADITRKHRRRYEHRH